VTFAVSLSAILRTTREPQVSRHVQTDAAEPGFDSFLDIVANLVGIRVILIMVIGVRAQDAWVTSAKSPATPAEPVALPDVEAPKALVASLGTDLASISRHFSRLDSQLAQQQTQRDRLRQSLSARGTELDQQQARLQAARRRQAELTEDEKAAEALLAGLQRQQYEVESSVAEPIILEHHPTPLAKTVFGGEEHFRLMAGRLAHVPLNQLTDQLKSEARLKVWKLENAARITEVIGPMEGFRLQYTLVRREQRVQTPAGTARRTVVELDRFVLVPAHENLGEPLEAALQPGSIFHQQLRQLNPSEVTITVWTYPDSYPEFRQLKEHLRQRGYLTAARPLPQGHPIGGSPDGSRSAAQ
jgi:multidrug efflux pump subunit AcrA (membrane-fusion protein)